MELFLQWVPHVPADPRQLPSDNQHVWRQALLTSSLDAVMLMDGAGAILDFNDEAARVFGLARETAVGRSLAELIVPPELRDAHRAGLARYIATGESRVIGRRIEIDAMRTDGERLPVELTIAVLQERPPVFIAHLRDIRSRVQAERRLKATAAVSQALATSRTSAEAIEGTLRALGESLGWTILQFWRVPDRGDRLDLAAHWPGPAIPAEGFARGEGLPGTVWQTGEPHWIEDLQSDDTLPRHAGFRTAGVQTALAFPVRVHGTVTAVIEAFTGEAVPREPELLAVLSALGGQLGHLLEEMGARAETERALLLAEDANRLKDEFLSMASHELRTPLNAVIGWVHLIREGRLTGPALTRAIDAIDRNAVSQARLVNDLLDMSRIIAGKFQLDLKVVEPREILGAAIEVVKPAADAKHIRISVPGPSGRAVPVCADAGRLQQVFWNVLSNAVKFTPRGGAIDTALAFSEGMMRLTVRDTGVGIAPQFLPRIFERFTQADQTPMRVYGGLGLGLSIAKQFMDLHGGTIAIDSPGVDRGTEVTITMPTTKRPVTQASVVAEHTPHRLAGVRVLVVDDEREAREAAAAILEKAGAVAECAATAEEALGCLTQSQFHVVVCDTALPGHDGAWLAGELQARPPSKSAGVGRVAVCAAASERARQQALEAGFDQVLDKPVTPAALVAAVAAFDRSDQAE